MITFTILALLAVQTTPGPLMPSAVARTAQQQQQAPDDAVDATVDRAADREAQGLPPERLGPTLPDGEPVQPLAQQAAAPAASGPLGQRDDGDSGAREPSKHQIKATRRIVDQAGDLYEAYGRCTGSMSPDEVEAVLGAAKARPAEGPYLLSRYAKGMRSPKGDEWCGKAVSAANERLIRSGAGG